MITDCDACQDCPRCHAADVAWVWDEAHARNAEIDAQRAARAEVSDFLSGYCSYKSLSQTAQEIVTDFWKAEFAAYDRRYARHEYEPAAARFPDKPDPLCVCGRPWDDFTTHVDDRPADGIGGILR